MKRIFSFLLLVLTAVSPLLAEDTAEADKQDILGVLHRFEAGILEKDANKLTGIFMYPDAPLLGVRDGVFNGKFDGERNTAAGLIKTVTGQVNMKEQLSEFDIYTNDGIATVRCNYEFYRDGKKTNYGIDIFSLIKTSEGWKILSIIYTVTMKEQ